ncbi:putative HAD-hydrolase YfnB [Peptococcaceae bacterium CEB3]|nr:putative HAD-hydrolase YfnB [Peptococcaceae bacterium CEB3]
MSQPFDQIRVIFFDLDDTLWDHRRNQEAALAVVHRELRLPGDFSEFHRIYHRENEKAWAKYRSGEFDAKSVRFQRYYRTLLHFGLDDPAFAREADRLYRDIYPRQPHLRAGAHETLTLLSQSYPLGLITNGFCASQNTKLETTGLKGYFRYLVFSESAGSPKPQPEIFHYALSLAGCRADEAVYIGDDPVNDVRAAQVLGWRTIFYNPADERQACFSAPPDAVVRHLREIARLLPDFT